MPERVDGSEFVGVKTTAETDLRPTGKVKIDGIMHDARSLRGWISKGTGVIVRTSFGGELEVEPQEIETQDTRAEET